MNICKGIMLAIVSGVLLMGLSACEKEGPAEEAGKAIDDAASDVAKQANEAKDAVEKKLDE
jgi:hypothetical protein